MGWTRCFERTSDGNNNDSSSSNSRQALSRGLRSLVGLRTPILRENSLRDKPTNQEDVVGVAIVGAGNLSDEPDIIHPIVRVHLVDANTGQYIDNYSTSDPATLYEGSSTMQTDYSGYGGVRDVQVPIDHVIPVATKPYHLKGRGVTAAWNDSQILSIPFDKLKSPNALILLEMVDFNLTQSSSSRREDTSGLHGLAWAYLQPHDAGVVGIPQLGPDGGAQHKESAQFPIKLQLYDYQTLSPLARYQARTRGLVTPPAPAASRIPAVYLQYLYKRRIRHESTILVRIYPVPLSGCTVNQRPICPDENQIADNSFVINSQLDLGSPTAATTKQLTLDAQSSSALRRFRYATECCVLPDRLLCRIDAGTRGAQTIRFSPNGRLLAVGAVEPLCCPIRLYDLSGFAGDAGLSKDIQSAAAAAETFGLQMDHDHKGSILLADLDGHHDTIYDFCFTNDERFLLSASADGLANVWDLGALAALPNATRPSYAPQIHCSFQQGIAREIYAAAFLTVAKSIRDNEFDKTHTESSQNDTQRTTSPCPFVITGAFDGSILHWNPSTCDTQGSLGGKVAHEGHVLCLEVDQHAGRVYSGDSTGVIIVWRRNGDGDCIHDFFTIRKIEVSDLKGKPIMSMQLHPKRRRGQLLVQAQASMLKLIDLATGQAVSHFKGNVVRTELIRAKFSPDGQIVICGSEDGKIYAWDTKSRMILASPINYAACSTPICDISWHPTQHVVAYTSVGGDHPILIYSADRPQVPRTLAATPPTQISLGHQIKERRIRLRQLQARRAKTRLRVQIDKSKVGIE